MSDKIKTREIVKDIKVIDKAGNAADRMKNAYIRTKDEAQHTQQSEHSSPSDYATDKATHGAENAVYETGHHVKKQTGKIIDKAKDARNVKKQTDGVTEPIKEQAKKYTQENMRKSTQATKQATEKTIKTAPKIEKTIKQSAKSTGKFVKATAKGTIKTAQKSVKSTGHTAKVTIKTSQQTAQVAAKTAQTTAKSAKVAAQAARVASKVAVQAAKTAVKATITTVKAIIAAIKGLTTLIAAGGWIAVVVILVICFVALIIGSCFGIFFSNESVANNTPMTQIVSELNTEYYNKIEQIKTDHPSDIVEIVSSDGVMAIKWDEVLSVYAVKVTTDTESATEVVTIDDSKKEILRTILWDMNSVTHSVSTVQKKIMVTSTDDDGNEITTTETISETILTINITHKSYSEMIIVYNFNAEQQAQLTLLMDEEYRSMWAQLLGGFTAGNSEIIISGADWIGTDIFSWALPESFDITSQYGYRNDPFTGEIKFHGGLDIGAPAGTPILASADGVVIVANATDSWGYGYGYHVKIKHNETFDTLYAHCSKIAVTNGQEVKKGQVIGFVGTTGNSTGNHLHFEMYQNGLRVNPLGFFKQ